jgi:hypothetical protein
MFNNCSNCAYGIEHKKENYTSIECSIKNDRKNSYIERYDGCPYFIDKEEIVFTLDKDVLDLINIKE